MDVRASYRRLARIYDLMCGVLLEPGRRQAIARMECRPGERVLEVGVGTGLSIPLYPPGVRLTGIDLSSEMLALALSRIRAGEDRSVSLVEMDAERMAFADGSFDKVIAMYVASVVPNPILLVREMSRVCRTDDGIFVLNHFHNSNPVVGGIESMLTPYSGLIGFRPEFRLDDFVRDTGLDIASIEPAGRYGYWSLIRARRFERRGD